MRRETTVDVRMRTRFPLCGGWITNWDQGYEMPTKYHMRQSNDEGDLYVLEMPLMHAYDGYIADNFTMFVTLPSGASDITVELPAENGASITTDGLFFGTLDFFGRPQVRINMSNVNGVLHAKDFRLKFKMDTWAIAHKPIQLSIVVFGFLLCFIVIFRFQLPIDNETKSTNVKVKAN